MKGLRVINIMSIPGTTTAGHDGLQSHDGCRNGQRSYGRE